MSVTKAATLWCDGEDEGGRCPNWTMGPGNERTAKALRAAVRRDGWKHRGGLDLCPGHADGGGLLTIDMAASFLIEHGGDANSPSFTARDVINDRDKRGRAHRAAEAKLRRPSADPALLHRLQVAVDRLDRSETSA